MTVLRVGTRASILARAQSEAVAVRLRSALGATVELVTVVSEGDRTVAPLTQIGGSGVFVGAVRDALAAGDVDVAVHSLKDLPTAADDRVVVAAVPRREDPRDALVARDGLTLGELPTGSTVATGSPRRAAQLRALGLGVRVVEIRGNVDTRLRKVAAGTVDAVLLARAGLIRLGRVDEITETLDPIQMLPAPGQGALAVEVAVRSTALADDIGSALDDPDSRSAVTAERALLRTLEAGCLAPIGALADVAEGDEGPEMWLRAVVAAPDGSSLVRLSAVGTTSDAAALGDSLARDLLTEGAASLMRERAS
ncbi:MAG: hydroxymethylbilane synthase [Nocardioidaceae bacterium]|jgi:hydroxymethylbilane synthase|nr:hydroxymethylbilane synthase [Nocardioidaceae bacterium]